MSSNTNRDDGRESYYSKLKSARASNYDINRALAEIFDNSIDAKSNIIDIKIRKDTIDNLINKIQINDNGTGINNLKITTTHGYIRDRNDDEGGEFGHGYKLALINLSNKATYITKCKQHEKIQKAFWDQLSMAEMDTFLPECSLMSEEDFNSLNYIYETGTFITLEDLIQNTKSSFNINKLIFYIIKRYHKFIINGLTFNIEVKSMENNSNIIDKIIINKDTLFKFKNTVDTTYIFNTKFDNKQVNIETNYLYIYKVKSNYEFYIKGNSFDKNGKMILVIVPNCSPNKKGNWKQNQYNLQQKFDEVKIQNDETKEHIDTIEINTKNLSYFGFDSTKNFQVQEGKLDIIRKGFIITDNSIYYRGVFNDGYANYIYHTLSYNSALVDKLIGTNVNKQNSGAVQNDNLYKCLQLIQTKVESRLRNKSTQKKYNDEREKEEKRIIDKLENIIQNIDKIHNLNENEINDNQYIHPIKMKNIITEIFKQIKLNENDDNYNKLINHIKELEIKYKKEIKKEKLKKKEIKKVKSLLYTIKDNSKFKLDTFKESLNNNKYITLEELQKFINKVFNVNNTFTKDNIYSEFVKIVKNEWLVQEQDKKPVIPEPVIPEPKPELVIPEPKPEPVIPEPVIPEPKPEPVIPEPKPEPVIPEPKPEPVIPEPKPEPVIPEPVIPEPKPEPVIPEPEQNHIGNMFFKLSELYEKHKDKIENNDIESLNNKNIYIQLCELNNIFKTIINNK
jgi:hypothetical protein